MLCTIWLLHHGYLSINSNSRQEQKIIVYGLVAPFVAILFAIVAYFTRNNDQK